MSSLVRAFSIVMAISTLIATRVDAADGGGLTGVWTGIIKEADAAFQTDVVSLTQNGDVVSGTIASSKDRSWEVSGFVKDQFVVLAYRSRVAGRVGVGTVFLIKNSSGESYAGYMVATNCASNTVVQVPYVLARVDNAAVRERYLQHLGKPAIELLGFVCPGG